MAIENDLYLLHNDADFTRMTEVLSIKMGYLTPGEFASGDPADVSRAKLLKKFDQNFLLKTVNYYKIRLKIWELCYYN